ncbi:MAG TPA: hypothetical protein VEW94_10605, partial [Chloroflexia bacterium]|nr:hypothetical protein [Chloroflexia bacterium]
RRSAARSYELEVGQVAAYVRQVLDTHSIYKRTTERVSDNGTTRIFYTNVQPDIPLILGTDMYVSLEPTGGQTQVTIKVESQPWIYGDIFGMYERYISTFFSRLSEEARHK